MGPPELEVCPHYQVAVVLPGEAPVCTFEVALGARPVDQSAGLAGLVTGQCRQGDPTAGGATDWDHRRLAAGCPRSGTVRLHRDGGFVLKDNPCPERRRGGFAAGQVSFTHPATAAWSCSAARRAGCWHDQP